MPTHTIAENLTRLQNAKTAIAGAITTAGGTVNSGDGLEDFATDIGTIPNGNCNTVLPDTRSSKIALWKQCLVTFAFPEAPEEGDPSTIYSIGYNDIDGLQDCPYLTTIKIPSSVTYIEEGLFSPDNRMGLPHITTIIINQPKDNIEGAPWGATNATVIWTG